MVTFQKSFSQCACACSVRSILLDFICLYKLIGFHDLNVCLVSSSGINGSLISYHLSFNYPGSIGGCEGCQRGCMRLGMMSKTVTFLQRCSFGQMVSFHALWVPIQTH